MIAADRLFTRTVWNEPILVYRTADGGFTALADRCCHRLAPLSAGRKEGDCLRCGYHGLKHDANGRCIEVPGQASVPPNCCGAGGAAISEPMIDKRTGPRSSHFMADAH